MCPERLGSWNRPLRSEGSFPRRLVGRRVSWPGEPAGLPIVRVWPARDPGFIPPSICMLKMKKNDKLEIWIKARMLKNIIMCIRGEKYPHEPT